MVIEVDNLGGKIVDKMRRENLLAIYSEWQLELES